jgi:hypothetical protein
LFLKIQTNKFLNFEETYHHHPAMRLIRRSLRREWRTKIAIALALLAGGAAFTFFFFKRRNILAIFGPVAVMTGLRLMWLSLRRPELAHDPLWQLLNHRRRQIVWVYSVNTRTMPFGFHLWDTGEMYFKLMDGSGTSLSLPARQLKMVSRFLNKLLPHASFGYSEERQRLFGTDPAALHKP